MTLRVVRPEEQGDSAAEPVSLELRARLCRHIVQARELETSLAALGRRGVIPQLQGAGLGRVAAIGAATALEPNDMLFGTQRDLGAALARGVSVKAIYAQVFGRVDDPSLGRSYPGAVHNATHRVVLSDSSPASHLVHAAGFGFAARLRREPRVALALFGGAAQQNGELHAGLNFAAVNDTATIFVARGPLADELPWVDAAVAWGIAVDDRRGASAAEVYQAVARARARCIAGQGPVIVDARFGTSLNLNDALELREAGGEAVDESAVVAELRTALAEVEAMDPIDTETLFEQLYADRPWWLSREVH